MLGNYGNILKIKCALAPRVMFKLQRIAVKFNFSLKLI